MSTVTVIIEDNSILPAESVALDWKVCTPCESPVAEYVHELAVPPVATKDPPSIEMVVAERFVSVDVPVSATVVEVEYELLVGEMIVEVGFVVSYTKLSVELVCSLVAVSFSLIFIV